jgi:hypothetical protein
MDKCSQLWTPYIVLPVPRLHQLGLSNGITVSLHGSLPATDEKLISLDVRLLSLFHPCDDCDCFHGVRLEISILWPKFCHPEHTLEKKYQRIVISSVWKETQSYHDTDVYRTNVMKCCVVLGGTAKEGGFLLLSKNSAQTFVVFYLKYKTYWRNDGWLLESVKIKESFWSLILNFENLN